MIRSLYDWVIRLAGHPRAIPALGVVSFLESSFFPIPPDVMLIPMVLANRTKAFRIALVCTAMGLGTAIPLGYILSSLTIRVRILQESLGSGLSRVLENFRAA